MRAWLLALVLLASPVAASGRAGVRTSFGGQDGFSLVAYVEQEVFKLGPIDVAVGTDIRLPDSLVTPYSVVSLYGDGFWVSVEVAKGVNVLNSGSNSAFAVSLQFGLFW